MKTQASKLVASFLALIVALALVATPLLASPAPTQTKAATAVNIITANGTLNSANAVTGGVMASQMTPVSQADSNGTTKTGMNFPAGNSDYIEITNTSWLNGSGFSFTGWLYWSGEGGGSQLHWQRVFDFGYESTTGAASCFYFTPLGMKNNEITGAAAIDGMGFCMYENASASTTTADDYVCLPPSSGTTAMAGGQWGPRGLHRQRQHRQPVCERQTVRFHLHRHFLGDSGQQSEQLQLQALHRPFQQSYRQQDGLLRLNERCQRV